MALLLKGAPVAAALTELAAKNFSGQLGRWCKERGVEYIGHIIEDNNVHGRLGCGEGHYFRAMSGQAVAGIDEIGGQILPGNPDTIRHEFINFDGRFFHYLLAKLGASAALMQTDKKGRLLCETFGTYGFGLGVRDMKWIADFLISRGVNHFVPHAFSMDEYPDLDCPPHFYAGGHNPQYPYFSRLMRYCNRLCHVFSNGRWIPEVGILYHAPMEWMDDCMTDEIPAQKLHEGHIDYAIVPSDALGEICGQGSGVYTAAVEKGRLVLGDVPLKLLIVPRGRYLDPQLAQFMKAYPEVKVLFIDALPEIISEDRNPDEELLQILGSAPVTALEDLVPTIRAMGVIGARVRMHGEAAFYHYEKESGDLWMVFNESVTEPIHGNILVKLRSEDRRVYRYDAMKNRVYPVEQILASGFDEPRMLCTLELMPYESAVFFTAAPEGEPAGDALEQIRARGTLTIAMEGAWQPWTYHDESGALTGFDVEVGALIADGLGVKPEYKETAWDGILAGVDSGRFDIACNGVGYTEKRAEAYNFSTPYVYTEMVLVVGADNEEIKSLEDLKGKKTANSPNSTYAMRSEAAGAEVVYVDTLGETMEMLQQGRVDATLNAKDSVDAYLAEHPEAAIKELSMKYFGRDLTVEGK